MPCITIHAFYFRERKRRDEDYHKATNELASFSFTAKNLHNNATDSLAMLAGYLSERPKVVMVAKRPF